MTEDVFNHHGGIIHQDADGEDQGKQADAVNGVIYHHRPPDGQQDDHGDDGNDNEGRSGTQPDQAKNCYDHRRF